MNLSKKTKKKVVCLGGINNNNIKKTKLIKPYGYQGSLFLRKNLMISQKDISYIKKETNKIQNLYTEKNFEKVIEKTRKLLKKDPTQDNFL